MREPEVAPLLCCLYPKYPNNDTDSSKVKSLGNFLNRSISFSFEPILCWFCGKGTDIGTNRQANLLFFPAFVQPNVPNFRLNEQ